MKFRAGRYLILMFSCSIFLLTGCDSSGKMQDGFYTAEMSEFSHGWKEYVCILVKDNTIISAEYNARNESGFIKSWDNEYMKNMNSIKGTYPNAYTREYVKRLIDKQSAEDIDAVSGATHSGGKFPKLAMAAIGQARKGSSQTIIVEE